MTPAPGPAYTYRARIDRWVDGDTVIVAIDLGFSIWSHQIVRLLHINAPELHNAQGGLTRNGAAALAAMVKRAPPNSECMIQTHLDHTDNWHRVLADIWAAIDPAQTMSQWALAAGWAVPWPKVK